MELHGIMCQAAYAYAPNADNTDTAIAAIVSAGERFLIGTGIGIGPGSVDRDTLRNTALGAWNMYCDNALETQFEVTSMCGYDLVEAGATEEQARLFSYKDMERLAKMLGERYVEYEGFWDDLLDCANTILREKGYPGITQSDESEEEE